MLSFVKIGIIKGSISEFSLLITQKTGTLLLVLVCLTKHLLVNDLVVLKHALG